MDNCVLWHCQAADKQSLLTLKQIKNQNKASEDFHCALKLSVAAVIVAQHQATAATFYEAAGKREMRY